MPKPTLARGMARVIGGASGPRKRAISIGAAGAFYDFLHIDGLTDSVGFTRDLVRRQRIGVAPGSAFGPEDDVRNDSYVRICFAQALERGAFAYRASASS